MGANADSEKPIPTAPGDPARPAVSRATRRRCRTLTVFCAVLLVLALGEVAARIAVGYRLTPREIEVLTRHTSTKGRYTSHAYLPYVLTPSYQSDEGAFPETHNAYGFRGKEFAIAKRPGVARVVCLGASSTYGIYVSPDRTYAARLEELLNQAGVACEVLNAGVPGYVSTDILLNLQLRVLPLDPDLVVIYEGRNELFPQAFNHFAPDYSHFRTADYSFKTTNYLHKPLFRASHLLLVLSTYKGDRLGWSAREENPPYGQIRHENRPTAEELCSNLRDPARNQVYEESLRSMIALCQARGIQVLLATMAFRAEKLATAVLENDPLIYASLQEQVEENNSIVRAVARRHGVAVVETAALATTEPKLFIDDCHCGDEGHLRRAQLLLPVVARLLGTAKRSSPP